MEHFAPFLFNKRKLFEMKAFYCVCKPSRLNLSTPYEAIAILYICHQPFDILVCLYAVDNS